MEKAYCVVCGLGQTASNVSKLWHDAGSPGAAREVFVAETVAKRANPLAPLTDAEIRALVAPADGRLVVRDPACRGLELRLVPLHRDYDAPAGGSGGTGTG